MTMAIRQEIFLNFSVWPMLLLAFTNVLQHIAKKYVVMVPSLVFGLLNDKHCNGVALHRCQMNLHKGETL